MEILSLKVLVDKTCGHKTAFVSEPRTSAVFFQIIIIISIIIIIIIIIRRRILEKVELSA